MIPCSCNLRIFSLIIKTTCGKLCRCFSVTGAYDSSMREGESSPSTHAEYTFGVSWKKSTCDEVVEQVVQALFLLRAQLLAVRIFHSYLLVRFVFGCG